MKTSATQSSRRVFHGGLALLTLGLTQYISPSVALLLGIWVFHEPFGSARQVAFGCIWAALLIFSVDALRRYRGGAASR